MHWVRVFELFYEGSLIIHIDDKDLSNILLRRSGDLGDFKAWDAVGLVLGGFVDSISIFFSDVSGYIKGAVGVIGLVLILRGLFLIYKSVFHPYSVDDLNREILQAKRIEINNSLIALVDGNYEFGTRFLLYHDDGWDCDFLPNHRGDAIGAGEYERQALSASLYRGFGITINPSDISFVTECDSNKRSTEHDGELRYYHYRLYTAVLSNLSPNWRESSFISHNNRRCRWMTIDEMSSDRRISEINSDVIALLKNNFS